MMLGYTKVLYYNLVNIQKLMVHTTHDNVTDH